MRVARAAACLAALVLVASCAGGEETLTIYLKQRLGPAGPPGQIVPVLMPVERERREGMAAAYQAVLAVRQGPTPGEWGEGFVETIAPETQLRAVEIAGGTATVELTGRPPDLYGSAAIVLSLTELPGIRAVRLLLDGRPCCVLAHGGEAVGAVTRAHLATWQGETCHLRTHPHAVRCRKG